MTNIDPLTRRLGAALLALWLVAFSTASQAEPIAALEDFNAFCLEMLSGKSMPNDTLIKRLDEKTIQQFIQTTNGRADTVLWQARSADFFIQTYEGVYDFCFLFSSSSNLSDVSQAYALWRKSLPPTYIGPDTMHLRGDCGSAFLV